jgi:hypothetical protein
MPSLSQCGGHSLRHLHDFVRQPTILDDFVRDSALLGLYACAGRNNAGCPHNCGSGPECNRAISTAGCSWFQASSQKSRRSAQRRFWCGAASELRGAACGAKPAAHAPNSISHLIRNEMTFSAGRPGLCGILPISLGINWQAVAFPLKKSRPLPDCHQASAALSIPPVRTITFHQLHSSLHGADNDSYLSVEAARY